MDTKTAELFNELLQETARTYNSTNRSYEQGNGCLYVMGERSCAIGRIMTEEGRKQVVEANMNAGANVFSLFRNLGTSILQEKWRPIAEAGGGIALLSRLQALHDERENWNELGISSAGAIHLLDISRGVWRLVGAEVV